jgi:hypothetical protein
MLINRRPRCRTPPWSHRPPGTLKPCAQPRSPASPSPARSSSSGCPNHGSTISEFQFRRFLRDKITPLFPDGLTVLAGLGQFKDSSGRISREGARLVILLYPLDAPDANQSIDTIREAYKEEFEQQSVLRTDSIECVSF